VVFASSVHPCLLESLPGSPLVFGALELFLNHAIILRLSAWLLAFALLTGAAAFANWYSGWRAKEEAENSRLLSLRSGWRRRFGILSTLGFSFLALLLAVVSWVGGVEATASMQTGRGVLALVLTLLAGAGLGTYIFFNLRNWRQISPMPVLVVCPTGRRLHHRKRVVPDLSS